MRSKAKTQLSLRLYQQLFAADVAVVRPAQDEASSNLVIQPAFYYRSYVMENQAAIGYLAYHEWQKQGCGVVALIPVWEEKHDPEIAVLYVSEANLWKLPLLESLSSTANRFPRWYVSLAELVRSQLLARLDSYNPETEVVILGQVEDISHVFPEEEMYRQIHQIEIFTFSEFKPSIVGCYEQFKGRACEFQLYE